MDERATVIVGDAVDVMRTLPPASVDMVLCDPPYGVTRNAWDTLLDLPALFGEIERVARPRAAVVFFSQGRLTAQLMLGPWARWWRYNLIWRKNIPRGFYNANRQPMRAHEDVIVFYREPPEYTPQFIETGAATHTVNRGRGSVGSNYGACKDNNYSGRVGRTDRHPTSVLDFAVPAGREAGQHPTQKPVDLCEFLIRSYTLDGGIVLDPTCGSGSTGVACLRTGRRFIGIERELSIARTACARLSEGRAV